MDPLIRIPSNTLLLGFNISEFKELKDAVDYAVKQLQFGIQFMQDVNMNEAELVILSLKKLTLTIYEVSGVISKFKRKYDRMITSRTGDTDMDKREIQLALNTVNRSIDNFRMDLIAYSSVIAIKYEHLLKLRKLLQPVSFTSLQEDLLHHIQPLNYDYWSINLKWVLQDMVESKWLVGDVTGSDQNNEVSKMQQRVCYLSGEQGMSKSSAIALFIHEASKEHLPSSLSSTTTIPSSSFVLPNITLLGYFFCKPHDAKRSNILSVFRHLMYQCATSLPELAGDIMQAAELTEHETDVNELFLHLVLTPLRKYNYNSSIGKNKNMMFVIDGMNFIEYGPKKKEGSNEVDNTVFIEFLTKKLLVQLPWWVSLVMTGRSDNSPLDVALKRHATTPCLTIQRTDVRQLADLERYIAYSFKPFLRDVSELDGVVSVIINRSRGSFEYLFYAMDDLKNSDTHPFVISPNDPSNNSSLFAAEIPPPPAPSSLWTLEEIKNELPLDYTKDQVSLLMEKLRRKNPQLFDKYQQQSQVYLASVTETVSKYGQIGMKLVKGFL